MNQVIAQKPWYKNVQQSFLALMIDKHPHCFVSIDRVPKPLKIGIARDIITNELKLYSNPDNKEFVEIRANTLSFLEWYQNRRVYLNAIINSSWRVDLSGNEVEIIGEQQKQHAKYKIFIQKNFNNEIWKTMSVENKNHISHYLEFLLESKFLKSEYSYPHVVPEQDRIKIINGNLIFPNTCNRFYRYLCFKWVYNLFSRRSFGDIHRKLYVAGWVTYRLYRIKQNETFYINVNELRRKANYNYWAKMPLWSYQEFLLLAFGIDPLLKTYFEKLSLIFKNEKLLEPTLILEYEELFEITYRKFNNTLFDGENPWWLENAEEAKLEALLEQHKNEEKQKHKWLSKRERTPYDLLKFAKEVGFVKSETIKLRKLVMGENYMEEIAWDFEYYRCLPLDFPLWKIVALACNLNPGRDVIRQVLFGMDVNILCICLEKRDLFHKRLNIAKESLGKTLKALHIVSDVQSMLGRHISEVLCVYDSRIDLKVFIEWAIEQCKWNDLHPRFLELGGYSNKNNTITSPNDCNQEKLSLKERGDIWQKEADLIIKDYKGQSKLNKQFISERVLSNLKNKNPESVRKEDGTFYPAATIKRNIKTG